MIILLVGGLGVVRPLRFYGCYGPHSNLLWMIPEGNPVMCCCIVMHHRC